VLQQLVGAVPLLHNWLVRAGLGDAPRLAEELSRPEEPLWRRHGELLEGAAVDYLEGKSSLREVVHSIFHAVRPVTILLLP